MGMAEALALSPTVPYHATPKGGVDTRPGDTEELMRDAGYPSSEPIKLVCFFCDYEAADLGDYDDHIEEHKEWLRDLGKAN